MKNFKIWATFLCCMAMLFSTSACLAETAETGDDTLASFTSRLDYVTEKDGMIECSVIIEALEGSFKTDVLPEEITLKVMEISEEELTEEIDPMEVFADVSELAVVANDGAVLEVSFVIPKGELNVDAFAIQGFAALAEGVLLDKEGNVVGEASELTVWELDVVDRAAASQVYDYVYLTLEHQGVYVAKFYISWDEVQSYDSDGKPRTVRRCWEESGKTKTMGFGTEICMKNATNISITAQGMTGLVWDKWRTPFSRSGLSFQKGTLVIQGTTLNQKAFFDYH